MSGSVYIVIILHNAEIAANFLTKVDYNFIAMDQVVISYLTLH